MHPVICMICEVATRACLSMSLYVNSSCHKYCSCLLCWSLWITTLDGSLLCSPYLHFACSLFFSPILPIQRPAFPTPHRKWFMVGIGSGTFLHWSSFNVMVAWLQGSPAIPFFPYYLSVWQVPGLLAWGLMAWLQGYPAIGVLLGSGASWLPAGPLGHPKYPTSIIIGTSLLLLCKFVLTVMRTPPLTQEKQGGFYQNKVNPSLTFIERPGI